MRFIVSADTDIGLGKPSNQDSMSIQIADTEYGQVLFRRGIA